MKSALGRGSVETYSAQPLRSKFLSSCFSEQLFGNGFAACCEDAALPFRKSAPFDFGLRPAMISNRRAKPKSWRASTRKGTATSSQQAAKPMRSSFGCGSTALRLSGERLHPTFDSNYYSMTDREAV